LILYQIIGIIIGNKLREIEPMTQPVGLSIRLSRQPPSSFGASIRASEDDEKHADEDIGFSVRASAEEGPFELRLVTPSGHYMVIPLTAAQKKQFNDYCQKLSNGKSTVSIDITNLHLVFKGGGDSFKTDYLDSDHETVKNLRSLCELVIDPKHKVRMHWQETPEGGRGNMAKMAPFAHLSPELKKRQMSDEQFEKSIRSLSDPQQKKARRRREISNGLVQGIKDGLQVCASTDGLADARLEAIQKASNQLNILYSFAIDFEIAHPTFGTDDYEALSQEIYEKYRKAVQLLKEKSIKDRALETIGRRESLISEEIDQLAKKLAVNGIQDRPTYETQSKRLGLKSEADSLEWAIPALAKAIDNDNEVHIKRALDLLPFKQFLRTLCPEDAETLSKFMEEQLVPDLGSKLSCRRESGRPALLPLGSAISV
jgi:hypothetical protein